MDSRSREDVSTPAARLNWLFDVFLKRGFEPIDGAPEIWRPYTSAEVGEAIRDELGVYDVTASTSMVDRLRSGRSDDLHGLAAVGAFFGAPAGFFSDDSDEVAAAQGDLIVGALHAYDVRAYRRCRGASPRSNSGRRETLRKGVSRLRLGEPQAPTPHCEPTDTVERTTVGSRPWDDPGAVGDAQASAELRGEDMTQQGMTAPQIRTLCLDLVADLGIVAPLDPVTLCRRLAKRRGRRIKLTAAELGGTTCVGHLVAQQHLDRILYETAAPRAQQAQVIYHEVIHLVLDHLDGHESLSCGTLLPAADGAGEHRSGLYSRRQEWEAETGATILSELSRQRSRPDQLPSPTRPAEQGIAAAFGLVSKGWQ